jgi:glutathione peroxidase
MKVMIVVAAFVAAGLVLVVAGRFNRALADGTQEAGAGEREPASFYDLSTRTLAGEAAPLARYRGQVALVVNTASKCGLTPQYAGLQALYTELAPRGFVVLGFPSNDFMGQEPGTPQEIQAFCDANYHVTFPLFEKVKVKGDDRAEIYRWLTHDLAEPTWNFTKFLVGRDGRVIARFGPKTPPDDPALRERIEAALGEARREP